LTNAEFAGFWPMVKKAAGYLARSGPVSPQDRWEEDPGYTPGEHADDSPLDGTGIGRGQRSLRDGCQFDLPPQTVKRYLKEKIVSPRMAWRFNHKLRSLLPGKLLRIELMSEAIIHWTDDDWKTCHDTKTHDAVLAIHMADLPTESLPADKQVKFTFHWTQADRWEGADFAVRIAPWPGNRRDQAVRAEPNG
jgi:hypothetical protein